MAAPDRAAVLAGLARFRLPAGGGPTADRAAHADRADRADRAAHADRADRADRAAHADRADRAADRADRADRTADLADPTDPTDLADLTPLCRLVADLLGLRRCLLHTPGGRHFAHPPLDHPHDIGFAQGKRWCWVPVTVGGDLVASLGVHARARHLRLLVRGGLLDEVAQLLGRVVLAAGYEAATAAALHEARSHAERIAAVRRQLFAERDAERRELERDLHDGAQHHLVALRMSVALLEVQLESGDVAAAAAGVARLRQRVDQAEQVLLNTAAGVSPPMLVDHGLVEALRAEFQDANRRVRVEVPATMAGRRFPFVVETAVYFTCLEAVNNARKHAPAAEVTLRLTDTSRGLEFSVTDDGPGLSALDPVASFGLGNMRSRTEAAGGRLELRADGEGTSVEGFIPI